MYVDPYSPEETLGESLSCLFCCHFFVISIMLLIKLTCYFTIALWEVFKVHIESSKIILSLFFFCTLLCYL